MSELTASESSRDTANSSPWHQLAGRVLDGGRLTTETGLAILRSPDEELLDLLSAAFRVRQKYFGKTVLLHFLMNAKSGLCPEDCSYCSQSRLSTAERRGDRPNTPSHARSGRQSERLGHGGGAVLRGVATAGKEQP